MVFAGRGMGKTGFGQFSLVYNALLFANMIQISLVTRPHNVPGTGRAKGPAYASYRLSMRDDRGAKPKQPTQEAKMPERPRNCCEIPALIVASHGDTDNVKPHSPVE